MTKYNIFGDGQMDNLYTLREGQITSWSPLPRFPPVSFQRKTPRRERPKLCKKERKKENVAPQDEAEEE